MRAWALHADEFRSRLKTGARPPEAWRRELAGVPDTHRDAWFDRVLQWPEVADDSEALPGGYVPYVPCSIDPLFALAKSGWVKPTDRCVDIGAGVGRAACALHLLTGAAVTGIEMQPALVEQGLALLAARGLHDVGLKQADVFQQPSLWNSANVMFFYCPFSGPLMANFMGLVKAEIDTGSLTQLRHLACVDVTLPSLAWLSSPREMDGGILVYSVIR